MTQPRVLVIDDDAAVREAVAEDLKREKATTCILPQTGLRGSSAYRKLIPL